MKRRRCKDKLTHPEHEWGMQIDGMAGSAVASTVISFRPGRTRMVPQRFWCPGIKQEAVDDEG